MKTRRIFIILVFATAVASTGCTDGALEVRHGEQIEPDAGSVDDANGADPTEDTGIDDVGSDDVGSDDTGTEDVGNGNGEDDAGDENGEPDPPPCDLDEFECSSDTGYRVCVDDGDGSVMWSDESCSGDLLCAEAANSLDDICQTCPESDLAPDKHTSPNAPTLSVGDTLSGLRLCQDPHGQNFFYLGETSSFDVHLEWEDHANALQIDSWLAQSSGVDWDERDWYSEASPGSYEAQLSESLSSSYHVYLRVYLRNDGPSSGVPYTISRSN